MSYNIFNLEVKHAIINYHMQDEGFCLLFEKAEQQVYEKDEYWFRSADLRRYLDVKKHHRKRINKKVIAIFKVVRKKPIIHSIIPQS